MNVRVIAATNRDLEQTVRDGKFREDLFYRLNVFRIVMPPLRERRADILPLTRHFLQTFSREFRRPVSTLSREAEQILESYSWPGNVRELRNVVERAVLLAEGNTLEPTDFSSLHTPSSPAPRAEEVPLVAGGVQLPTEGLQLDDVEKRLIGLALERTRGNQTRAAALLGLNRDQIRYRMEKFGLLKSPQADG